MKKQIYLVIAAAALALSVPFFGQETLGRQSFGVSGTFAPDSSHILIGISEQRRTWTAGLEYCFTLKSTPSLRIDYEASVIPFFQERDPTITDAFAYLNGYQYPVPGLTGRVIAVTSAPLGYVDLGALVPYYGVYSSEKTYAFGISPIGARINGFNSHRLQPTFSTDLGILLSTRDLPIDNSSSLNYMFSFGPGFEYFYQHNKAVRLEYLYRHISNANMGYNNPGVDQGVIRVTFSKRR